MIKTKKYISSLYRSPSQNSEEFRNFLTNFEHLLSDTNPRKPSVSVIFDDFNSRSTSWWSSDIDLLEGSLVKHMFKEIALLISI